MTRRRSPQPIASAALCAMLIVCLAAAVPGATGAKTKKKKRGGGYQTRTFSSGVVNAAVPDAPGGGIPGFLRLQLPVSGKFRGKRIDDVNVSLRVSDAGQVNDLNARLTAPNGASIDLVRFTDGPSWGAGSADCNGSFLTLDDETPFELLTAASSSERVHKLLSPYAGVAQPDDFRIPLAVMDRGPIRGTWSLQLFDRIPADGVATVNCWQLHVTPIKPAQRKRERR